MNKFKLLSISCISLLLVNIALLFFIFNGPKPRPNENRNRDIVIEKLNFDKQQIQQYDSLIDIHKNETHNTIRAINNNRQKLYKYLNNDANINNKDSILFIIADEQAKIEQINFEHFLAIKKICNPEQLIKYKELTNQLSDLFDKTQKPPRRNEGKIK